MLPDFLIYIYYIHTLYIKYLFCFGLLIGLNKRSITTLIVRCSPITNFETFQMLIILPSKISVSVRLCCDLKMHRSLSSCSKTHSSQQLLVTVKLIYWFYLNTMTHLETRHLQLSLPGVQLHTPLPAASPACELKQQLRLELMRPDPRYELRRIIKCQLLHI